MRLFNKMRKKDQATADQWFSELDDETQQETTIKYLRKLDNTSLKNLYEAVDHYRQGDKILQKKVKDPDPVKSEDLIDLKQDETTPPSDS